MSDDLGRVIGEAVSLAWRDFVADMEQRYPAAEWSGDRLRERRGTSCWLTRFKRPKRIGPHQPEKCAVSVRGRGGKSGVSARRAQCPIT